MLNLPKPDMILAGFLLQIFIGNAISLASLDNYNASSVVCTHKEIAWVLFIAISVGVAFLTAIESKFDQGTRGIFAFAGSLVLNLIGYKLGYMALCILRWSHSRRKFRIFYHFNHGSNIPVYLCAPPEEGNCTRRES